MRSRSQDHRACVVIEGEQSLFGERGKKLNHEERIAGGLLMHQLRQRRRRVRFAAKRIGNQPSQVVTSRAARARSRCTFAPRLADRLELAHQRMRGIDLVVAIGTDQHQMSHVRLGQQILEQIERRRVEPLQIVEEQRQRMFRPGEYADEPPEYQLEAALRILRLQAPGPAAARR